MSGWWACDLLDGTPGQEGLRDPQGERDTQVRMSQFVTSPPALVSLAHNNLDSTGFKMFSLKKKQKTTFSKLDD